MWILCVINYNTHVHLFLFRYPNLPNLRNSSHFRRPHLLLSKPRLHRFKARLLQCKQLNRKFHRRPSHPKPTASTTHPTNKRRLKNFRNLHHAAWIQRLRMAKRRLPTTRKPLLPTRPSMMIFRYCPGPSPTKTFKRWYLLISWKTDLHPPKRNALLPPTPVPQILARVTRFR